MPTNSDLTSPAAAAQLISNQADALLDRSIQDALAQLEGAAPLLAQMICYHLGLIDSAGEPTMPEQRRLLQGKRLRPSLALLAAEAVGGEAATAAPLAAAIELLHNFTLIHDDIQDRSPNRRHRATVWRIWGDAQAINAGDALFAVSNLTLLGADLAPDVIVALTRAFNRTTIEIVRGQVLDMSFEGRDDVAPHDYLDMISGKTAAILRFAAEGGAIVGGGTPAQVAAFARLGEALGIGFQIRDDLLGVWSDDAATGKTRGDDIRRRKQSLPLLLLRATASPADLDRLNTLYASDEVDDTGIAEVLALLDRYAIQDAVQEQLDLIHQQAIAALAEIELSPASAPDRELQELLTRLQQRRS